MLPCNAQSPVFNRRHRKSWVWWYVCSLSTRDNKRVRTSVVNNVPVGVGVWVYHCMCSILLFLTAIDEHWVISIFWVLWGRMIIWVKNIRLTPDLSCLGYILVVELPVRMAILVFWDKVSLCSLCYPWNSRCNTSWPAGLELMKPFFPQHPQPPVLHLRATTSFSHLTLWGNSQLCLMVATPFTLPPAVCKSPCSLSALTSFFLCFAVWIRNIF